MKLYLAPLRHENLWQVRRLQARANSVFFRAFSQDSHKILLVKRQGRDNISGEMAMIHVPTELLWDYDEAPEELLWRLQRIADFFPLYGKDRETVELLHAHRGQLRLDGATRTLIEEYHHAWELKSSGHLR